MQDFEPVFTVTDYYDGPRAGIANFGGNPHAFRSLYADIDTHDDDDVFALKRWTPRHSNWHSKSGPFGRDGSPRSMRGAPIGRRIRRCRKIASGTNGSNERLAKRMAPEASSEVVAKGDFRAVPGQEQLRPGVIRELEVRWYEISAGKNVV